MKGFGFADKWVTTLPRRWGRNGAAFGAIFQFAQLGTSQDIDYLMRDNGLLIRFGVTAAVMIAGCALLFFLLGTWARSALSRAASRGAEWSAIVGSVPLKWTMGGAIVGLLILLADALFEWRGARLQSGGSMPAVAENIGYAVGLVGSSSLVAWVVGLVSRRGLRRAISNDAMVVPELFR